MYFMGGYRGTGVNGLKEMRFGEIILLKNGVREIKIYLS